MGTIFFGNKVQIIRLRRVQGRFQGCNPGIGNGPGRQSFAKIGVIGGLCGEMLSGKIAIKIFNPINNGWIT